MAKWRFDPVNIGFCCNHSAVQGAGGRGPADAPVSAHVWRLPAEHRRQVLPEGHWAVLARGLPELWPVRLSTRGGGPPALLQAGKKAVSERLPQVGVRSKTSGFHPEFAWGTSNERGLFFCNILWTFSHADVFLRLFGQDGLCASCEKRIRAFEMTMRVRDKVYHLECFKCAACQKHFCVGDRYLLINSDIVCEQDIFEWTKLNNNNIV